METQSKTIHQSTYERQSESMSQFLRSHKEAILKRWEDLTRQHVLGPQHVEEFALRDSMPDFLERLAEAVSPDASETLACEASDTCALHVTERVNEQKFNLDQVLSEYVILERTILEALREAGPVDIDEYHCVLSSIFHAMREVASVYIHIKRERNERLLGELRGSEERYRLVVEGARDFAIFRLDSRGIVMDWNTGAEKIFGYTKEEMIGRSGQVLWPPEDLKNHEAEKEMECAASEGKAEDERWHVRKDGSRLFASGLLNPLKNDEGKIIGYVKLLKDFTEQKLAAEERLRLLMQEQETRALLQRSAKRIYDLQEITEAALARTTTLDDLLYGILEHVQKTFEADTVAILLLTDDEQFLQVRAAYGLEKEAAKLLKIPKDKGVAGAILHNRRGEIVRDVSKVDVASQVLKDQNVHTLMGVPLRTKDRSIGVIHVGRIRNEVFTDDDLNFLQLIADRIATAIDNASLFEKSQQAVEELKEERSIRERFVAALTHDLRNPLSAAKTSAGFIRRYPDKTDGHERSLARIENAIDRADRMIRDLLDSTRLTAGQPLPLEMCEVDLTEVVQNVVEEFTIIYGDRFRTDIPERLLGYWNPEAMTRILENLCGNAAKYGAPDTPITIKVSRNGDRVCVQVHNLGNPIPEEFLPRLFTPFKRTAEAQASGQRGWGLGLVLVKGLTDALGGKISVASSVDGGTTFTVEIPFDARPFQKT